MKKLLLILGLVAFLALPAQAQYRRYIGPQPLIASQTQIYLAATTNTVNAEIDARESEYVALLIQFRTLGAGTSNIVFNLQRSLDRTTYESAQNYKFTLVASGTNTVNLLTNINVGSVGFLRLNTIENTATNIMTNVVVNYTLKQ